MDQQGPQSKWNLGRCCDFILRVFSDMGPAQSRSGGTWTVSGVNLDRNAIPRGTCAPSIPSMVTTPMGIWRQFVTGLASVISSSSSQPTKPSPRALRSRSRSRHPIFGPCSVASRLCGGRSWAPALNDGGRRGPRARPFLILPAPFDYRGFCPRRPSCSKAMQNQLLEALKKCFSRVFQSKSKPLWAIFTVDLAPLQSANELMDVASYGRSAHRIRAVKYQLPEVRQHCPLPELLHAEPRSVQGPCFDRGGRIRLGCYVLEACHPACSVRANGLPLL